MNTNAPKKANSDMVAAAEDWHPADVVAALHKAGWTVTALGKSYGLTSGQTMSKALSQSYPVAEKRIADALGKHPKEIWPSRYFENGEPKPRGFRATHLNRLNRGVNGNESRDIRHESA